MYLKSLELVGFKSFAKKTELDFTAPITAVVGPNGSGKTNVSDGLRFVLGEQSTKAMRGKRGEDMIWNGSNALARGNRASVKVVFDNSKKLFNLEFDEVSIERTVHRDGVNEYFLNGTRVRLKDISELLAQANIGSSGHHLISQGEADRVLSVSPRERRAFIEDALGLRLYHFRIEDARRKLEKTEENKKQVVLLRKENAPHLAFLGRQMEKIARARSLREELREAYRGYFARERIFMLLEKERLLGLRDEPERALRAAQKERDELPESAMPRTDERPFFKDRAEKETALRALRERKADASLLVGRLEGQLELLTTREEEAREERPVPLADVSLILKDAEMLVENEEGKETHDWRGALSVFIDRLRALVETYRRSVPREEEQRDMLLAKKEEATRALNVLYEEERVLESELKELRERDEHEREVYHESKERRLELSARIRELEADIERIAVREEEYIKREDAFNREIEEAVALIGEEARDLARADIVEAGQREINAEEVLEEDADVLLKRRRDLERLKVRLEEAGAANAGDIEKEYEDAKERDAFHARELEDLERARISLEEIIRDLEEELSRKFTDGIARISREFDRFFKIIFEGGTAEVFPVEEKKTRRAHEFLDSEDGEDSTGEDGGEEQGFVEQGVEVTISLPNKRLKGLSMLSGGERALTSIALIFAMAEVSAPPFIVLDETDAALDEANSRRYGDMVEALSKKSQLILITHNRETMSRAGILYGVTMGGDGISRLLSVKFEDALAVAK